MQIRTRAALTDSFFRRAGPSKSAPSLEYAKTNSVAWDRCLDTIITGKQAKALSCNADSGPHDCSCFKRHLRRDQASRCSGLHPRAVCCPGSGGSATASIDAASRQLTRCPNRRHRAMPFADCFAERLCSWFCGCAGTSRFKPYYKMENKKFARFRPSRPQKSCCNPGRTRFRFPPTQAFLGAVFRVNRQHHRMAGLGENFAIGLTTTDSSICPAHPRSCHS